MSPKILIVDDDRNICEILEFNLKNEGFEVEIAYSAEDALKQLSDGLAVILLDVMMGGMSGYKMAEKLRTDNNQIPIIFLTAKDTENDMLTGFSVGGDDYISKPFSVKEVIARVKALIKRFNQIPKNNRTNSPLVFGNFVIDVERKELIINNSKIILTKTEFEILRLLAENPERMFSRDHIIDCVWKETPHITERTVDVHIARLRKKMGEHAAMIVNRSGYGYRFNA
ncbi:MAG: response regulator transcription factor [Bacteroidales bacterium]|nr:response regulator transcription factor [Bacteroidales bacterium]